MANKFSVVEFNSEWEEKWDRFVLECSVNGTFLQTRNFLNYHPAGRFRDCSLLLLQGNEIVAVIPANEVQDNGKVFVSHQGSTFGGIVLKKNVLNVNSLDCIFDTLEDYLSENTFSSIIMKQPGRIYCKNDLDLLEYFFFNKGYTQELEVGYYIDFADYKEDIIMNYSTSRRRDYRYALKNNFTFRELANPDDIIRFYSVLESNYKKFDKTPVHKVEELIEFKEDRLKEIVRFYGVFNETQMVAGAMVFCFEKMVFHTQYLAVNQNLKSLFINEFLYTSLIEAAKNDGFYYLSFGTSTFDSGHTLNTNLARYKEGFGTKQYNNITYRRML